MLNKQKPKSSCSNSKPTKEGKISKKEEVAEEPHTSSSIIVNEDSLSVRPKSQSLEESTTRTQVPDDKVELSEPNTVRSILDRAKEVLKTLDYDGSSSSEISKRGGIMRSAPSPSSRQFVNDTAKAVKQVTLN